MRAVPQVIQCEVITTVVSSTLFSVNKLNTMLRTLRWLLWQPKTFGFWLLG